MQFFLSFAEYSFNVMLPIFICTKKPFLLVRLHLQTWCRFELRSESAASVISDRRTMRQVTGIALLETPRGLRYFRFLFNNFLYFCCRVRFLPQTIPGNHFQNCSWDFFYCSLIFFARTRLPQYCVQLKFWEFWLSLCNELQTGLVHFSNLASAFQSFSKFL